ncbi:transposase [Vibrio vulnificus]|uniref:transposase n=1 Tax=Vibrio vulnificus TaxID=672 RepID=UPI0018DC4CC6|nr:transposase [Vibrio vulnificus]
MGLTNVDVWFQDEARFGQQNTTTRLWAERGSRPRVIKQQQFEYAYLFGSVCPARGIGEAMVVPWVHKNIMVEHLKQLSAVTEKGRHAVVLWMARVGIQMTLLSHLTMSVSSSSHPIHQS